MAYSVLGTDFDIADSRNEEADLGAAPGFRFNGDFPVALPNDSIDSGQSQPGALPRVLGRVKGFKGALPGFFVHANARVANAYGDVLGDGPVAGRQELRAEDVFRLNMQPPGTRRSTARPDHDIEPPLLEMAFIHD